MRYTHGMRFRDLAFLLGGAGAAMLVYGSLHGAKHLVVERHRLPLPFWPKHLEGYRIAVLSDLHLQGPWSLKQTLRAVRIALAEKPDMIVLAGDIVDRWRADTEGIVLEALAPLRDLAGKVVAIPGNHDHYYGDASRLAPVFAELGIVYLRNDVWVQDGITWVGIESAFANGSRPADTLAKVETKPAIVLWHEPDMVTYLPDGASLMISGHSHGGQFRFPGGFTPKFPHLGRQYTEGFYTKPATPIYVSRGVGVTGPPSRFNCPPEVSLLTLVSRP